MCLPKSTILLFLLLFQDSLQDLTSSIRTFSNRLHTVFEEQSRIELVRRAISKEIDGKLETISIEVAEECERNIVESAELAARSHVYTMEYDQSEESCQAIIEKMNEVDAKLHNVTTEPDLKHADLLKSGIHVTVEAYRCDNAVRRDFEWTGAPEIERTFRDNLKRDRSIRSQFIGTNSGLTRLFPVKKWTVEPEPITIDLFDPRFRPWFIAAQSAPKDVLFLIDMSGSVKGQTVHLIRMTVLHILATLGPNDYVNAIWFNSRRESLLRGCAEGFIPATTRNKKAGEINVTEVWNDRLSIGSGGHKLIMLFTDGIEEWPVHVIANRQTLQHTDPIRVFGFSMGYGTGTMPALDYIACNTNATYAIVDSIADVKRQSVSYLAKLSNLLAIAYAENPPAARPVTWVTPQMDSQGAGPTLTISMPILNTMENGSGLLGVAGVDVRFKQIAKILPEHEHMYAFIVDNNGIAVYHPKLKIPKTEVYSVRRTACYDKRSRSRGGGRIQFGEADERVLRLMGLVDSIPTIDITELEPDSEIFREFRQAMIDRNCRSAPLLDGDREYWCRSVEGTPLTIGFVVFRDRSETILNSDVSRPKVPNKALVGHYVPKRGLCRGDLDHVDMTERFNAFLEADKCEMDTRLPYALAATLNDWTESWPDLEENATCATNPLPENFDPLYHITSFVNTFNHITAFYPKCNFESLRPIVDVLELDRYPIPTKKLRLFSFNDNDKITITAYGEIFDSMYARRLAVGGVQWSPQFIDHFFHNATADMPQWAVCYQLKRSCHLITSDGYVVAGKRAQQHLSSADALLFDYLIKKSIIKKTYRRDNQAQCTASRYLHAPNKAPPKAHSLHAILFRLTKLLTTAFWLDLWLLMTSSIKGVLSQPVMVGGTCQFSRIKHKELCSLEYSIYEIMLIERHTFMLNDGVCSRQV
ncbi:Voltage-dependent calcium channel subunit alpha-2/delta-2 [Toxocara canis]|uniref:Voltage-dependent calcium channel subunit alpha-2/delta-2 n=1 Tax=Toxocara canis TaxID=6265 RepID=A0A0B2VD96_TOXCA|nr:Voltage-dependent calcium channel subunit alpha-2/delta-2 [Toxocara canis]